MTLNQFVRKNRESIDDVICDVLGTKRTPYPNDEERENWVLNDEFLYNWAIQEGVDV
jgi:hypothetical protein